MTLIALEEHIVTKDVRAAWNRLSPEQRQDSPAETPPDEIESRLSDWSEQRINDMDETGVDIQVLSLTAPGVQNLDSDTAGPLARDTNDIIAAAVAGRPDRFQGFATLATPDPDAAAKELQRSVDQLGLKGAMLCGRTGALNMDDPVFLPIYEAAAALRVPLYIHPQVPRKAVRDAYYCGFNDKLDALFATAGLGWHYETGIQLLRLAMAGTFDRFPDLQIVVGHWGEVVLFYLERIEILAKAGLKLERPLGEVFRQNVSYTPSGIFSQRYLRQTIDTVGVDRVMFSADYPFQFAGDGGARRFLEAADLTPAAREAIAHGNWERLISRTS